MKTLTLAPVHEVHGEVTLPGSKSISNRALLLAALASGQTEVVNVLHADDTRVMLRALRALGIGIESGATSIVVTGSGGPLVSTDNRYKLDLGLAGTAYRPLTAALCLGAGTFELHGNERMAERPIAPLVDALRALGASIEYLGEAGFPPLVVRGTGLDGGRVSMPGNLSSQFLTSLLLAAPYARAPIVVDVPGEQVSKPYLDLTLALMSSFGITARHADYRRFDVPVGRYRSPGRYLVEGDASNATYFLAAAAIKGGTVRVNGLGDRSVQGDLAFVDVLRQMGAHVTVANEFVEVRRGELRAVDLDLNPIPDAAMTVAVLGLFASGTTRVRNVYNWRVKETDRLDAMATELRKLGATVECGRDWIAVTPPSRLQGATIDTYGDHRMAMCFSLASLGDVPVTINDPDCVAKTFPEYFTLFASICRR
jgi:3-phosphoshikimate 1-carboxyvinyltransferase